MYSLKALFQKQPAVIAGAIRSVFAVLILAKVIVIDVDTLAAGALALEAVLSLFVYTQSTSATFPVLEEGTTARVAGSEDTVVIQKSPPGPVGVDGGAE